jgi:DNA-binding MarR family transcriptional regulator
MTIRQLIDTLVVRGYITREVDPANGSVTFALTESLAGPVLRRGLPQ